MSFSYLRVIENVLVRNVASVAFHHFLIGSVEGIRRNHLLLKMAAHVAAVRGFQVRLVTV